MADENTNSSSKVKELTALGEAMAAAQRGETSDKSAAAASAMAGGEQRSFVAEPEAPVAPKLDAWGRAYATGRRKNAVARVWIKPGRGLMTINGKPMAEYFARPTQQMIIEQAFKVAARDGQFDVFCTVSGGGLSGQAGAVRHGISRALVNFEPDLRPALKRHGFLTRDDRQVERKKYGRAKARRSFQFSKR